LKGMPNRHDIHLINVFFFNELTKISPSQQLSSLLAEIPFACS
jgi:hypothetical protein